MSFLPPPPRQDKEFTGQSWQDWLYKLQKLLFGMEHIGGHWYLTNGNIHAITTSAGIQTTTLTAVNTVTPTLMYSYALLPDELHADEIFIFTLYGSIDAATAAETITLDFKVGGVSLHTLALTPKNATLVGWKAEYLGVVRSAGASGTFIDYGNFKTDIASVSFADVATTAIDTTANNLFEVYATWGAAKSGNSISCTMGSLSLEH